MGIGAFFEELVEAAGVELKPSRLTGAAGPSQSEANPFRCCDFKEGVVQDRQDRQPQSDDDGTVERGTRSLTMSRFARKKALTLLKSHVII